MSFISGGVATSVFRESFHSKYSNHPFSSVIPAQALFWGASRTTRSTRSNSNLSIPPAILSSSLLVNPPISTLPPPLNAPTRLPSQSTPSYYYALGKSYLKFYKTGLKAVWINYKAAQNIRASLSKNPAYSMSRADFQLLRRSRADAQRIPLFLLLFLVCGEFTPLVVLVFGAVVPRTCKVPAQIEGERRKLEERRRRSFREGTLEPSKTSGEWKGVKALSREQTLHIGRTLGLYGTLWDYIGGFPISLLRRRITAWIDYLGTDDSLIVKAGGTMALTEDEVCLACEDRGVDTLGRSKNELKMTLQTWLQSRKNQMPVTQLLLSRPNVW